LFVLFALTRSLPTEMSAFPGTLRVLQLASKI
jgi:hypothetical protein